MKSASRTLIPVSTYRRGEEIASFVRPWEWLLLVVPLARVLSRHIGVRCTRPLGKCVAAHMLNCCARKVH